VYVDEAHPEDEVYLETGCPKYAMIELIKEGWSIFMADGKKVKAVRDRDFPGEEKTDELDACCIQILFHENPEVFKEFTRPEQFVFMRDQTMAKYEAVTKELVGQKNRRHAFIKEFGNGDIYDVSITQMEVEKKSLLKVVKPLVKTELGLVDHIKGVGPALVARILAMAHPNKFKSKSAYLKYLGFIDRSKLDEKERHKYHRGAKSVYFLMAESTMKQRDPEYRKIYDDVKAKQLALTCASCWLTKAGKKCRKRKADNQPVCKIRIHTVALNRVSTALAKYFYVTLKDVETKDVRDFFD